MVTFKVAGGPGHEPWIMNELLHDRIRSCTLQSRYLSIVKSVRMPRLLAAPNYHVLLYRLFTTLDQLVTIMNVNCHN